MDFSLWPYRYLLQPPGPNTPQRPDPPELRFLFDSSTERRELQTAARQSRHWIAARVACDGLRAGRLPSLGMDCEILKIAVENGSRMGSKIAPLARQDYSNRRISTGKMRDAERAGKIVAAMLMNSAAAEIQIASSAFV